MAATCPDCDRPFTEERSAVSSVTGRRICKECDDGIVAAAAGIIANPDAPVTGAIATEGWFRRHRSS